MASYFHLSLSTWHRRIQILAAPLTCLLRMIYAAMERRQLQLHIALVPVQLQVRVRVRVQVTATATATCEKLSDISEFVGSHRLQL